MTAPDPNLTYLAKDYASFRALMLDHLAQVLDGPIADDPASTGIALVEVLAYVGDYLSYYQDAVATEAYLATARRRISVSRHARLLDYRLNEGCNARVLVQFTTSADGVPVRAGTRLLTGPALPGGVHVPAGFTDPAGAEFETMHDGVLHRAHNAMRIVDGAALALADCHARLVGHLPHLSAGDILVFRHDREQLCHPVRLTRVTPGQGETRVEWHPGDIPADVWPRGSSVSVAGNIILADHGLTVTSRRDLPAHGLEDRFSINCPDLVLAEPFDAERARYRPVAEALVQDPHRAEPQIALDTPGPFARSWIGQRDTLRARPTDRVFGVELDGDGGAALRMGDGVHGLPPPRHAPCSLRYRTGAANAGVIGTGVIARIAGGDPRITGVGNPVAAVGGIIAEPLAAARARASDQLACAKLYRCVTEADYAAAVTGLPDVARCRVERSGGRVMISLARISDRALDPAYVAMIEAALAPVRLIGDHLHFGGMPDDPAAGAEALAAGAGASP